MRLAWLAPLMTPASPRSAAIKQDDAIVFMNVIKVSLFSGNMFSKNQISSVHFEYVMVNITRVLDWVNKVGFWNKAFQIPSSVHNNCAKCGSD